MIKEIEQEGIISEKCITFPDFIWNDNILLYEAGWFLDGWRTFKEVIYLCNISDEDAVYLKLKYGEENVFY